MEALFILAERQGFEPWVPVRAQRFSRPPRSTTPAPFLGFRVQRYDVFVNRQNFFDGILAIGDVFRLPIGAL